MGLMDGSLQSAIWTRSEDVARSLRIVEEVTEERSVEQQSCPREHA